MNEFKDRMIEAVETGRASEDGAYEYVREAYFASWDDWRTRAKEQGWRNPAVANFFCQTCHHSENGHPHERCQTGFVPGDPEKYRAHNARLGF